MKGSGEKKIFGMTFFFLFVCVFTPIFAFAQPTPPALPADTGTDTGSTETPPIAPTPPGGGTTGSPDPAPIAPTPPGGNTTVPPPSTGPSSSGQSVPPQPSSPSGGGVLSPGVPEGGTGSTFIPVLEPVVFPPEPESVDFGNSEGISLSFVAALFVLALLFIGFIVFELWFVRRKKRREMKETVREAIGAGNGALVGSEEETSRRTDLPPHLPVELTEATTADILALIDLEKSVGERTTRPLLLNEEAWRSTLENKMVNLIWYGADVAGYIAYEKKSTEEAEIGPFVVAPRFLGKGIDEDAFLKTLDALNGVKQISVDVYPENARPTSFYSEFGFVPESKGTTLEEGDKPILFIRRS